MPTPTGRPTAQERRACQHGKREFTRLTETTAHFDRLYMSGYRNEGAVHDALHFLLLGYEANRNKPLIHQKYREAVDTLVEAATAVTEGYQGCPDDDDRFLAECIIPLRRALEALRATEVPA